MDKKEFANRLAANVDARTKMSKKDKLILVI